MPRPSLTALTIVAKLSSVSIMVAASLATSVPVTPIAIPISAVLRAGASLTPSPVMATMWPSAFKALMIRTFCSGAVRAKTPIALIHEAKASSSRPDSSLPSITSPVNPSSCAIAKAVTFWSPVIILTAMPACWQSLIASRTSGRGGSIKPTNATKFSSLIYWNRSALAWKVSTDNERVASANTRKPLPAIFSFCINKSFGLKGRGIWFLWTTDWLSFISTSGAPLMNIFISSSRRWKVAINLCSASKGISAIRGSWLFAWSRSIPPLAASTNNAPSIGSPRIWLPCNRLLLQSASGSSRVDKSSGELAGNICPARL